MLIDIKILYVLFALIQKRTKEIKRTTPRIWPQASAPAENSSSSRQTIRDSQACAIVMLGRVPKD